MPEYTAPLREIDFALRLAGLDQVSALPGKEDATLDLVTAVLEEAGKFGAGVLAPLNGPADTIGNKLEAGVVTTVPGFRDAYSQFVEGGWNSVSFDAEFGGQGLPLLVGTAVGEIWHSANMAFGLCPMLTGGAVELLSRQGSPEQKETYLPKLISGEWTGTMCLTEPSAGSDLSGVRSKAVPEGDHYLISGQKIFISWGEHDLAENIIHMVLARLPGAPEGTKGISLFLVPKFLPGGGRNDLICSSIEHKMGLHGSPTCVLSFGDGAGAVGWLIGQENRGLEYMFIMMNNARLNVGLEGIAVAERAFQAARDYARERIQGRNSKGQPAAIIEHADVKRMLVTMKAETEALRTLCYFAAARIDVADHHPDAEIAKQARALVDILIPLVKAGGTEAGMRVSDTAIQVFGGMGFIEETGVAQYFRDVRVTAIYEGTNGIQSLDLAGRKTQRDGGATIRALLSIMKVEAEALAPAEPALARAQLDAIAALDVAVGHIVAVGKDGQKLSALAVPYLRLFVLVAGGWMMVRQAQAALAPLEGDDPAFLQARLGIARVYGEQILVQSSGLLAIIAGGAQSVLSFDAATL